MNDTTHLVLSVVAYYWPVLLGVLAAPFAIVANLTGHLPSAFIALLLGAMLAGVMGDRTLRGVTA